MVPEIGLTKFVNLFDGEIHFRLPYAKAFKASPSRWTAGLGNRSAHPAHQKCPGRPHPGPGPRAGRPLPLALRGWLRRPRERPLIIYTYQHKHLTAGDNHRLRLTAQKRIAG